VVWTIAVYGVATNESVWTIEKNSQTYDLRSCTTYSYQYVTYLSSLSLSLILCLPLSLSLSLCLSLLSHTHLFLSTGIPSR
jgi:Holliday junction resolvase RusA-like endonuclease